MDATPKPDTTAKNSLICPTCGASRDFYGFGRGQIEARCKNCQNSTGDFYALDRDEDERCERSTEGCSINHSKSGKHSQCDTW